MKSATAVSAISWPRPMTIRWSAVSAISLIRWLETKTVRPSAASDFIRLRIQQDALGVEPVDRLVEHQHRRVAEQRGGDAEPLAHAEREALRALAAPPSLRPTSVEHLVDPAGRDAVGLREAQQVVVRAAAAVHRLGVEQRADLAASARASCRNSSAVHGDPASVGSSRPRIIRIVVDLPAPLGPRKPVTGPAPP